MIYSNLMGDVVTANNHIHKYGSCEEPYYRVVFDNMCDGILLHENDEESFFGRIVLVNNIAIGKLGYGFHEMLEMNYEDLFDLEISKEYRRRIVEEIGGIGYAVYDDVHRCKDGSKIGVQTSSRRFTVNGKHMVLSTVRFKEKIIGFKNNLNQDDEVLLKLMASVGVGIWEYDVKQKDCIWSDELWKLFGLDSNSCYPSLETWSETIISEDRVCAVRSLRKGFENGDNLSVSWRGKNADGSIRWLKANGISVRDEDGEVIRCILMVNVVDCDKGNSEKDDKLEKQVLGINRADTLSAIAAGIAHDLNNMLGIILGNAQIVLSQLDDESDIKEEIEEVDNTGKHMAHLITKLQDYTFQTESSNKNLDIIKAISDIESMLRSLIGRKNELIWNQRLCSLNVRIEPCQLDQILVNLCMNAKEAVSEKGVIQIDVSEVSIDSVSDNERLSFKSDGKYACISVADNGMGISRENMSKIMDPYFTTKNNKKYHGLGLATVYRIVTEYNGFVKCNSEIGYGTVFKVYLPLYEEEMI